MVAQIQTNELEKKSKAAEESAFIIAHELRAPVASVLGLINLIMKSELDEEARTIEVTPTYMVEVVAGVAADVERSLPEARDEVESQLGTREPLRATTRAIQGCLRTVLRGL